MNGRFAVSSLPASVVIALTLLAPSAQAACPSQSTAGRFTINGAEVTDKKTGLVWARCSLGQSWSGSACTGSASSHTHQQALQLAQAVSGWRLPNVKELGSIADKGCVSPAIDGTAFPNTPSNRYWTATPYAGGANLAWYVGFSDGEIGGFIYRGLNFSVRLVRASQ